MGTCYWEDTLGESQLNAGIVLNFSFKNMQDICMRRVYHHQSICISSKEVILCWIPCLSRIFTLQTTEHCKSCSSAYLNNSVFKILVGDWNCRVHEPTA